jgi:hypothetical protein
MSGHVILAVTQEALVLNISAGGILEQRRRYRTETCSAPTPGSQSIKPDEVPGTLLESACGTDSVNN